MQMRDEGRVSTRHGKERRDASCLDAVIRSRIKERGASRRNVTRCWQPEEQRREDCRQETGKVTE
jgi:hypothetical protein